MRWKADLFPCFPEVADLYQENLDDDLAMTEWLLELFVRAIQGDGVGRNTSVLTGVCGRCGVMKFELPDLQQRRLRISHQFCLTFDCWPS